MFDHIKARHDEEERNRRWSELQRIRLPETKDWQEIKQHVQWLYERIKIRDAALDAYRVAPYLDARHPKTVLAGKAPLDQG